MASQVILKKSSVAARVPTTEDLAFGELALNYADGLLYYKKSDGTTIASIGGGGGGGGSDTLATVTARGASTSTTILLNSIKGITSTSPSDLNISGGNATIDDSSAGGVVITGGTSTNMGTGTIVIGSNSIGGDVALVSNTGTISVNGSLVSISSTGNTGTINNMSIGASTASTGRFTTTTVTSTTASTTTGTGALIVSGGVGVAGNVNIGGSLTVNGTTTTINSNTLTVDDKNIELGSVASGTISTTGTVGSITGTGPWTATITNMTTTTGLIVGSTIAATAGTGTLYGGSPTSVVVASIVSATSITYTVTGGTTPTAGTVTAITTTGATDSTANGGGITLRGATDKTIVWDSTNSNWTSSENLNIATGKAFKINNVSMLSSTTLGSSIVNSSLTKLGTLAGLVKSDASGNLTVDTNTYLTSVGASSLTGTTLSSTVVNSSLTKLGTLAGLVKSDASGNLTVDTNTYLTSVPAISAGDLTGTTLSSTVVNSSLTKLGTLAGLVKSDVSGNLTVDTNTYLTSAATTGYSALTDSVANWAVAGTFTGVLNPTDIFFKPDGTKMFLSVGATLNQYTLSTAWDPTSAGTVTSFTNTWDSVTNGIFITPDGSKLITCGQTSTAAAVTAGLATTTSLDQAYTIPLQTAWDITSGTFTGATSYSFATISETNPQGITFNDTGTIMYMVGATTDNIYQYTLSIAYNVASATLQKQLSIASVEAGGGGIRFNVAGTRLYLIGSSSDNIVEYRLTTAWDIATAAVYDKVYVGILEGTATGIFLDETSNNAYMVGTGNDLVTRFTTNSAGISIAPALTTGRIDLVGETRIKNAGLYVNGNINSDLNLTIAGTAIIGANLSSNQISTSSTALTLGSSASGAITIGSTTSTGAITVGQSTAAQTLNLSSAATAASTTKVINIGTSGLGTSTTQINYGSAVSGALNTHTWNAGTANMSLTSTGALAFTTATGYGTTGQVLTSQGNAAPTWSSAGSGITTGKAIAMAMIFGG